MSSFLAGLELVVGAVLLGIGLTILALSSISYQGPEGPDPVERFLTLVGSGVPGTLGLVLMCAAIL